MRRRVNPNGGRGLLFPCALAVLLLAACGPADDDDSSTSSGQPPDDDSSSTDDDTQNDDVRAALDRSIEYFRATQQPDGWWEGPFITDASITAYYIILMHYLELVDEARQTKAARYVLDRQQADGSWNAYPGGPGDLDISVICYFGLKLAGHDADEPALASARQFILAHGGGEAATTLPQIMFALFAQVPWKAAMPPLNTTVMLFEDFIYYMGYAHVMIPPMTVLAENYHKVEIPAERGVAEIFLADPWAGVHERTPRKGCCQHRAVDWMLARQEADGNWSGVFQNTLFCLLALKSTGDPQYDDRIAKGMAGVVSFQNEDETTINQQFSESPVMDTAYVVDVLLTAGAPSDDPAIEAAVEWLVSKEINIYGDWSHLNPDGKPGGWSFEHNNRWYPDVDCSVIVLKGLAGLDDDHRAAIWDVIQRANDWVITMHNRNGGWAAWDKNALDITWLQKIMNSPWVVPDLSTADVTARALQALGSLGYPGDFGDASVLPAAIEFLKGEQEDFGGWYGRWGVNYVYGAGEVLKGLALAGEDPSQPYIREAVDWLKSVQNADAGWGESPASYEDPSLAGIGESTAAQTAYAVSGLMFAGELESDAVARGIRFLLDRQLADGSWRDEPFMGTNIAGVWYARYDLASVYKPAAALAQYLRFAAANER